ncbi:MAG: MurR/RpiR family transcriptional regulator [Faecalibacillus sp.]
MYIIDKLEIAQQSCKSHSIEYTLAHYLLTHLLDINNLSLKKISLETHLSRSTIIRFCQQIGYDGFTVFMNHLQEEAEEVKYTQDFFDNIDYITYEDSRKDFLSDCQYYLKEVYQQLLETVLNSQKILFYGHNEYISCFQHFMKSLFFLKKEMINNMCLNLQEQQALFDSLSNQDLIIIIEPKKDWRSYKELLVIYDEVIQLDHMNAKKVFIGQKQNQEVDISITLPYTYYDLFYKDFFMKLDIQLTLDMNKKSKEKRK